MEVDGEIHHPTILPFRAEGSGNYSIGDWVAPETANILERRKSL
jgi:hypothetical protein